MATNLTSTERFRKYQIDNPHLHWTCLWLPKEAFKAAKIIAIEEDITVGAVLARAMKELAEKKRGV